MEKLHLAQLPTPIEELEYWSQKFDKEIFIKRDDQTGLEFSGNKIRKLEYVLYQARLEGKDTIITRGAIQSNHCRATAAACARLGLNCHLVLEGQVKEWEGNLFLDQAFGAQVHLVGEGEEARDRVQELMARLQEEGHRPYFIPLGASNALGSYGYAEAFEEILLAEEEFGFTFDHLVVTVGSGGTYAGLLYGKLKNQTQHEVRGYSVSKSVGEFEEIIRDILLDMEGMEAYKKLLLEEMSLSDRSVGQGYAQSSPEEVQWILDFAKKTGILFDPCYTGKMMKALEEDLAAGYFTGDKILVIHTGGQWGWTQEQRGLIHP